MSFKNIRGQAKAISVLKSHLEAGRFIGGYIFSGPEGVGKKIAAKAASQQINCLSDTEKPCGECSSCLKIEAGQHPDVHIIDNEEADIKIDDIRQLQRQISLRPYEGKANVFIIDNAHRLNPESSNALLKILEEPPGASLIILITDRPRLLFKTILSRCKTIKFAALLRSELEDILVSEYSLARPAAHFLAYFSEGRFGRALRLKDADLFSGKNLVIDKFILSGRQDFANLKNKGREELRSLLNILAVWFRDVYLLKNGIADSELINLDRRDELKKASEETAFTELDATLSLISNSIRWLEQNINTKLLLNNLGAQLWKN